MTTHVGKFDVKPNIRYISRWKVEMRQPMTFSDLVDGLIVVPAGYLTNFASIRGLRVWLVLIYALLVG